MIRRSSVDYRERIAHLEGADNFHLHYGDLGDSMSIIQVVSKVSPDFYRLTDVVNLWGDPTKAKTKLLMLL